jgi:hypothetical protein
LRSVLQWEPQMMLREGIVPTYRWIAEQTADTGAIVAAE